MRAHNSSGRRVLMAGGRGGGRQAALGWLELWDTKQLVALHLCWGKTQRSGYGARKGTLRGFPLNTEPGGFGGWIQMALPPHPAMFLQAKILIDLGFAELVTPS